MSLTIIVAVVVGGVVLVTLIIVVACVVVRLKRRNQVAYTGEEAIVVSNPMYGLAGLPMEQYNAQSSTQSLGYMDIEPHTDDDGIKFKQGRAQESAFDSADA